MLRFWLQKLKFMCIFASSGHWGLVRAEWKLTKKGLDDAKSRSEEIERNYHAPPVLLRLSWKQSLLGAMPTARS